MTTHMLDVWLSEASRCMDYYGAPSGEELEAIYAVAAYAVDNLRRAATDASSDPLAAKATDALVALDADAQVIAALRAIA